VKEWFTAAELAGLRGMPKTPSAVLRRAHSDRWERRDRDQGKGWEYSIASLPEETRVALLLQEARAEARETQRPASTPDEDREELWAWYERLTNSMREEAERRYAILYTIQRLVADGTGVVAAVKQVGKANRVSAATIHRWRAAVKGVHPGDWLPRLAPGWTGRTAVAEITPKAWDFFLALYLTPEQRSVPHCYQLLKEAAAEHGWEVASERTFQRRVQNLDPRVKKLKREGEGALLEQMRPPFERTVQSLHAMEALSGDGYTHNLQVRFPSGNVGRPTTWFWQDVRSRKIVGYQPDESENGDQIRRALGHVVERYGIPNHVTIDNTRAAANKAMTGRAPGRQRFGTHDGDALGILPQLGIQVHWTSIPGGKGHGQAKPVERIFGKGGIGEYVDKHPKAAGAYTGRNTQEKPHNHGERVLTWAEFIEVLDDGVRRINALEKARTEIGGGRLSRDEAFAESYERNAEKIRRASESQRRLWLLAAEQALVQRDGSIVLKAGTGPNGRNRYSDDCLYAHQGHTVVVRFDADALHEDVHVYELGGRYIGTATCIAPVGFGDVEGGKRYGREIQRLRRNAKERAEIEQRMTPEEALELMPTAPEGEEPETNVVRPAFQGPQQPVEDDDFDAEEAFSKAMAEVRRAHFGDGAA
jgi:transposase InsO family protein